MLSVSSVMFESSQPFAVSVDRGHGLGGSDLDFSLRILLGQELDLSAAATYFR